MKLILILVFIYLSKIDKSFASTFEDHFHERLMDVGWRQCLSDLSIYSSDERRYILGLALRAFGANDLEKNPERKENFELAQTALLSIPNHSKYYQEKIESIREEVILNSKKSAEQISELQSNGQDVADTSTYEQYCENAFRILTYLPSSESVTVLGFYLNDPVGKDGKNLLGDKISHPGDDFAARPINAQRAAFAIRLLGIENPPFKVPLGRECEGLERGEVERWTDWWNEVKAGNRTYRFIGSKIEYGSDGPASEAVIQRADSMRQRDKDHMAGHAKLTSIDLNVAAPPQKYQLFNLVGVFAACTLLAVAAWYFLKSRGLKKQN
jgi:hypothetical protein